MPTASPSQLREAFFQFLFDEQKGYVCIALADRGPADKARNTFRQVFFEWPKHRKELSSFIDAQVPSKHIWFGVNLFARSQRRTEYAQAGRIAYADLDACNPDIVEPPPSISIESSPGRFQAVWRLDRKVGPDIAADYSRRIAYKYSVNGADKSGWDTTQLLRVPYTHNFKYEGYPEVKVLKSDRTPIPVDEFEKIEIPEEYRSTNGSEAEDEDMPDIDTLPKPEHIIYKYVDDFKDEAVLKWYSIEPDPDDDWSAIMWRFVNAFAEAGATQLETFTVAYHAKCNKYERDKRPIGYLWREVKKAFLVNKSIRTAVSEFTLLRFPDIQPEPVSETVIDKYLTWGINATDAVPIFHELGAFIILSSLLSSTVRLELSHGTFVPNIWGMVLGESTLTRKTTAMRLATDVIAHIDGDIITTTDGSVEGLLTALQNRPSMASMFFRDEISGFFDSINRKDYLAGMAEAMTNLYDAPAFFKRTLRKETIIVETPILIFYGGGIKDRVYELLSDRFVLSGFLPRFMVVSGKTDLSRIRPTAPAIEENLNERQRIMNMFHDIYDIYNEERALTIAGQTIMRKPIFHASLSEAAWNFYQVIEMQLQKIANDSHVADIALPTFERISRSMLKMAILLGAARQEPVDDQFTVEEVDVRNAAYYVQHWGPSAIDLIYNVGKTSDTRVMDRIRGMISRNPGIPRTDLMRNINLTKRQMDMMLETLVDRGEIYHTRKGKGQAYWPS